MKKNTNCMQTIYACFIGYIVQAIVNNFVPLLFVTFQNNYHISLERITFLITLNFIIQLFVDLLSAFFIDRIGYRISILIAHILSAAGLILLTVLPEVFSSPYTGLVIAVIIYAIGGGLLEVLVSPIIEACPTDNKEKAMSLLHSFYCWGHVGVVLLSTAFFWFFGISHWKILALMWAVIPIFNTFLFRNAPIYSLHKEGEQGLSLRELCTSKIFWMLMLMMTCAGASEQAVSQWASTFAETSLHISKTLGDLAGPLTFAACMGASRLLYGKYGDRIRLDLFMRGSCILCILSYLCISILPSCAEPFGMCALRILRWNYVAGTFQHRIRLYSTWRHNNVCPPCTCRRSGMFRWSDACRSGIFLRRRQSENRDFRSHYFSGRPAPWSNKIKKI